jgi:cell division septation protein DedD
MSVILLPKSTLMTELVNKKYKEGRYRVESNIADIEPVVEPLTDPDDGEDAIDRLLINTGFDAEEEFSALPPALDKTLPGHQDPAPLADAFRDDVVPAALQIEDDGDIEPADIGSPIADIEVSPEPSYATPLAGAEPYIACDDADVFDDPGFSSFQVRAAEWVAPPADTTDFIEPVDLESPVPNLDLTETLSLDSGVLEDRDGLFEQKPEPNSFSQRPAGGEPPVPGCAIPSGTSRAINETPQTDIHFPEKDIVLDAPALPGEGNRLLSQQEEVQRHMERLETQARNTRRLAYAAIALSLAALGGTLAVAYLNAQVRTELSRLKVIQSVMEEDMGGLSEKLDRADHAAEESAAKLRPLAGERAEKPEDSPIAIEAPPPPAAEPIQVKAISAPAVADIKPSVLPVRKPRVLPAKPSANKALPKPLEASQAKPAAAETRGQWSIHLASFRQIDDAKEKAAEYRKKGVSVKVTKVDIKQSTWYRLSVPGFKTKEAASTYSSRLKKQLRLNSIWIAAI